MRTPRTLPTVDRGVTLGQLLLALLLAVWSAVPHVTAAEPPAGAATKWQADIARFEQADAAHPPAPGGVVFVGSSSIRLWNLPASFPGQSYLNRGFGGSHLADSVQFAHRIVIPYAPRVVVVYAGDNDLASGKSPESVADDYQRFVARVHAALPATRILYIAIKPSLKRWALVDKIRAANRLIAARAARDSRLGFIDIFAPMLAADGQPRRELLANDQLHLSPAGYELWTGLVSQAIAAASDQTPDVILHSGRIATVDARFRTAEALAWKGDRILRVGTNDVVLGLKGPHTRVIDLQGRRVIPGLIDSHVHAGDAAMHEFDHPVPDMETIADVLAYVTARTKAVPVGQWIWVNQIFITRLREQRFPTRAELDAIAPEHPVVFSTGPDAMANSLALRLSGIDKDFVVTGAGSIEKDPRTGELTGMLRGNTKRYLKSSSPPSRATEQDREDQLEKLLRDYNSVGLTTIGDRDASRGEIERYERLRRQGRLTTRVAASHSVNGQDRTEAAVQAVQEIARHPLRDGDAMLRIVGIKTYLDGGMLTGSAFLRAPWGVSTIYGITDPEYRGVRFIPDERLLPLVRATVEHGLQFTAHAVGDGAVHALLQTYDEVNKTSPVRPTRPCLTHSNFMSREAIEQMVRLGVVADIQPAWLYLDSRTLNAQFGYQRLRYFQPLRTMFDLGAIAGGGSDHMQKIGAMRSINPYSPLLGIATAVTRRAKWYEGQMHPEEALSRAQALRFYTMNNAYILFLDDQTGSLEPGKLADLVVLDRDILACPDDELRETRVLLTVLGGQPVHAAEEFRDVTRRVAPGP